MMILMKSSKSTSELKLTLENIMAFWISLEALYSNFVSLLSEICNQPLPSVIHFTNTDCFFQTVASLSMQAKLT